MSKKQLNALLNGDVATDYDMYDDVAFQDEIEKYADVTTDFDMEVDKMLGNMHHEFY